jgi:IrrE N-terminal-like domain
MRLQQFIDRLEEFCALQGVSVLRTSLSPWVVGRTQGSQIILHTGLTKEQQLLTLIHELTHFLVHQPKECLDRTVCEYEAEAVENWVAGQLGLKGGIGPLDQAAITDDLLACSVTRVRWVSGTLLAALQDAKPSACSMNTALPIVADRLQAQATVQI